MNIFPSWGALDQLADTGGHHVFHPVRDFAQFWFWHGFIVGSLVTTVIALVIAFMVMQRKNRGG